MPQVTQSPLALSDLNEIWRYIAPNSVIAAHRFLQQFAEKCELLASHPEIGQSRPEFATGRYRSFTLGAYVIYYQPVADGIFVARVLHGSRDHKAFL
jgi:toxin ParE1/3/4